MECNAAVVGLRELESLGSRFASGPLLVHSDVFGAANFVEKYEGKREFLDSHWKVLRHIARGRSIWLPTFNYDYAKTGIFDVRRCRSQVGALSDFVRTEHAEWRTEVPIYSIAGIGPPPIFSQKDVFHPFARDSTFEQLLEQDGHLLFYGGKYFNTFLHYVEHLADTLTYRYPKEFPGYVISESGDCRQVSMDCHCRPLGRYMEYDVVKILNDLVQEEIAELLCPINSPAISIRSRELTDYWLIRLKQDPYYFLDERTTKWVDEAIQELGRPFCLTDFEPAQDRQVLSFEQLQNRKKLAG